MKWTQEKNHWHSGKGHRITKLGLEGDERRYAVYFDGSYLGSEDTFNEARLLAISEKAQPSAVEDKDDTGHPVFLKLTAEERAAARAKAPPPTPRQPFEWPSPTRPKKAKRGSITVADIAKELGIEASEARAALRKAKVAKPEGGWSGDEAWADDIRATVKKAIGQ